MSTTAIYSNVERRAYQIVNNITVNAIPMDNIEVYPVGDHVCITMSGSQPNAGALVAFKIPPPTTPGAQLVYSGLDFDEMMDDDSLAVLKCKESDLKNVWTPANGVSVNNVMDGSAQLNQGAWQIDDATRPVPNWVSTGFAPGPLTAGKWNHVSLRHVYDPVKGTFSFLSITDRGQRYLIPSAMQNIPLLGSTWDQVLAAQFQLCLAQPGAVTWRIRGVTVIVSDETIP